MTTFRPTKREGRAPHEKKLRKRRPPSLFIPGMVEGRWSKFEFWLRTALDLYVGYREITVPMLSADGQPVLDSFGRPRLAADAEKELHGIRKGAVWFTRETLRAAWFIVFQQDSNRIDHADHYSISERRTRQPNVVEAQARGAARNKINYSHPMDTYVDRMSKDGRLIRKSSNRLMLSMDMCLELERPDAWKVHMARGQRWEGLIYSEHKVKASDVVTNKRQVRNSDILTIMRPNATLAGIRHPNQIAWDGLYEEVTNYLLFDRDILYELARQPERYLSITSPHAVSAHISRWLRDGRIIRVLPNIYQSTKFAAWNHNREKYQRPILFESPSWMLEWMRYWAPYQGRMEANGVTVSFNAKTISDYFDTEKDTAWVHKFMPNGLSQMAINARLTNYRKNGYLAYHERKLKFAPAVVDLFRPMWEDPLPDMKDIDRLMQYGRLTTLPVAEAVQLVDGTTPADHVFSVLGRVFGLPAGEQPALIAKLAKKVKSSPGKLLDIYRQYKEQPK